MVIYTKKGDYGTTSLFKSTKRVFKDDQGVVVLGSIDELNSQIGFAKSLVRDTDTGIDTEGVGLGKFITSIQQDLFEIAAEIASQDSKQFPFSCKPGKVKKLEILIDGLEKKLLPLSNFIFPGGLSGSAGFHMARSVCRRVEREVVHLARSTKVNPEILKYFNRLSDALFVLARWVNKIEGTSEEEWKGK